MNLHHKQKQIRSVYGHLQKSSMIKNTDYIKANAFAFYSINGKIVLILKIVQRQKVCASFWKK